MTQHDMKTHRIGVSLGLPRMAGMSLIELMIAVTIGLLLLTGVITVFVNTSAARNEIERTSRQIENGRYAAQILSDDLELAGFYGELDAGTLPAPPALPDPCSVNPADWIAAIPIHVRGYNASNGSLSCLLAGYNYKAGTDVLVVRRVRSCAAGVAGCEAAVDGRPYIQVSLCTPAIPPLPLPYKLGLRGTVTFDLQIKGCATAAALRQYLVNIYFISTDNGAGQNVPTLKRLEFDGAAFTAVPLVEGIEELNFEYGMDTNGDGLPDVYTANPSAYPDSSCDPACQVTNWMNVMTAKVFILARNIEPSPDYRDTKTYRLGAVTVAAANDPYRRHVYSGLVRIANPAGRTEKP